MLKNCLSFSAISRDYMKKIRFGLLCCGYFMAFRMISTSDICAEAYLLLPRVNFYIP